MKVLTVREMVLCGLFIALITAGTLIRIPVGTDVYTLQFLFTLMAGMVLGARLGAWTVGVYVAMGLVGIPVFASGGGPAYLLQPTFGYLLGFILQAWFCGWYARKLEKPGFLSLLGGNVGGMAIVYVIGITWFYVVSNHILGTEISAWTAILYCGILQAPPDFLLCMAAAGLSLRFLHAGLWLEHGAAEVHSKEVEEV